MMKKTIIMLLVLLCSLPFVLGAAPDASWTSCKNVNISGSASINLGNQSIAGLNVTEIGIASSAVNELRMDDEECYEDTDVSFGVDSFTVMRTDDSTWAEIAFITEESHPSGTNLIYSLYYNTSTPAEPGLSTHLTVYDTATDSDGSASGHTPDYDVCSASWTADALTISENKFYMNTLDNPDYMDVSNCADNKTHVALIVELRAASSSKDLKVGWKTTAAEGNPTDAIAYLTGTDNMRWSANSSNIDVRGAPNGGEYKSYTARLHPNELTTVSVANHSLVYYENRTGRASATYTTTFAITTGAGSSAPNYFFDNVAVWNGTEAQRVKGYYPQSSVTISDEVIVASTFSVSCNEIYNASAISSFKVTFYNSTYSTTIETTSGSVIFNTSEGIYSLNISSADYFNKSYADINISFGSSFTANLTQAHVFFNATTKITRQEISSFNVFAPLQATSTANGSARLNLSAQDYNISMNGTANFTGTLNINVSPLDVSQYEIIATNANITFSAHDIFDNATLSNFKVTLENAENYYSETLTASGSALTFLIEKNLNYTATINMTDYAINTTILSPTVSENFHNFSLYPVNLVYFTVYNQNTSLILNTTTVTIEAIGDVNYSSQTTDNGTLLFESLAFDDYEFKVSASGYESSSYFVNITPLISATVNAYLLPTATGEFITFNTRTFQDAAIEGVLYTVARRFESSFVTVEQKRTDFSGNVRLFLDQSEKYRMTITHPDYDTKVIEIQPVSTSYTVLLSSGAQEIIQPLFSDVQYSSLPASNIITPSVLNFSLVVSSSSGILQFFGVNATVGNVSYIENVTGSAAGGTAILTLNLTQETGAFNVDYFIKAQGYDLFRQQRTFNIFNTTPANYSAPTLISVAEETGISSTSKSLVAVFSSAIVMMTFGGLTSPGIGGLIGLTALSAWTLFGWIALKYALIAAALMVGGYVLLSSD